MLSKDTVFEISREGERLLSNLEGNNGRALRRFLERVSCDGLVHQVFTQYGDETPEEKLALYPAYAESIRAKAREYSIGAPLKSQTLVDESFGCVQNVYEIGLDIKAASVRELRSCVREIMVLSALMHRFAANPDAELYAISPEVKAERQRQAQLSDAAFNRIMRGWFAAV